MIGLMHGGAIAERYTYDPYGRVVVEGPVDPDGPSQGDPCSSGCEPVEWQAVASPAGTPYSAFGNPFMWTGQRYDAVTGTYHFHYRTYSPGLGRWLQRDPAGYVDGVNLHEYVRGNPVARKDSLGLEEEPTTSPAEGESFDVPDTVNTVLVIAGVYTWLTGNEVGGNLINRGGAVGVGRVRVGDPEGVGTSGHEKGRVGIFHTHPKSSLPFSDRDMMSALRARVSIVQAQECRYALRVTNSSKANRCILKGGDYVEEIYQKAVKACLDRNNRAGKDLSSCGLKDSLHNCLAEGACAVAKECGMRFFFGCGKDANLFWFTLKWKSPPSELHPPAAGFGAGVSPLRGEDLSL